MNVEGMKLFCTVYEVRGIARAAEVLYTSHQAVSKRIKAIEEELGASLFLRSVRGLEPTPAGDYAYQAFKGMLEEYAGLEGRLAQLRGDASPLRVAIEFYNSDIVSLDGLLTFGEVFDAGIDVSYQSNRDCYGKLLSREVDCALVNRPLEQGDKFAAFPLKRARAFAFVSAQSPLADRDVLELADFDGMTMLTILEANWTNDAFGRLFSRGGARVDLLPVSYDLGVLAKMIRSGRGFHIAPEDRVSALVADPAIVAKEVPEAHDVFELAIVCARSGIERQGVASFVAWVQERRDAIVAERKAG